MELHDTSLRRLLPPADAESFLAAFTNHMPGQVAALLDSNGKLVACQGSVRSKEWPVRVGEALRSGRLQNNGLGNHAADESASAVQPTYLEGAVGYPLLLNRQNLGWLVLETLTPVGEALQAMLTLLLKERIEKRRLARETLDRYREVNLLYHLGERFSARLEVGEILHIALAEAQRIIPANCGVVWLTNAVVKPGVQAANFGMAEETEALARFLRRFLEENQTISAPDVVTDLVGEERILASVMYAPLIVRGSLLGALALGKSGIQTEFNAGEEKLLLALAGQAASAVERAELHQEELQHQRIAQELAIGQRIQRSLLPTSVPRIPGWEFATSYQAANQVGGDFYDIFPLPVETGCQEVTHYGLTIADVSGKGIPAALMMAFSQGILHSAAFGQSDTFGRPAPGEVLFQTNQSILQSSHSGLLLTAFYAVLNPCTGVLSYANGGHEPPILYRAARAEYQELICGQNLLLGARREQIFKAFETQMEPGDLLLLYTDGVTEARNADGAFFAEEGLYRVLSQCAGASCTDVLAAINEALNQFTAGAAQSDDITLFALRRLF